VSRLTDLLRCEEPLQLAPMGSVSSTARLPLAVAAAGGHAVYPGLALPPQALAPVLDALTQGTEAFGVNFIVPVMNRESLELACERAPYVDFFLTEPDAALVETVRGSGAVCGWQVEAADEARAAEAAGCDIVIAKGLESGGRKRIEGPPLGRLLEEVLAATSLPVIAAGGIATRADVSAAFAAGAHGVRVGTRFIASDESEAHPVWVQAVIDATAEDSVVTTAFNNGMPQPGPHRVLRSAIEAAEALPADDEVGVLRMAGAEIPVPRFAPQPPNREATGHVEAMALYAGRSAGAVTSVQPAADIVRDLAAGIP
jgi:NAD(P)H-dependent flavin oxidoreductase YrpB (nitropropane dioxygenase family)